MEKSGFGSIENEDNVMATLQTILETHRQLKTSFQPSTVSLCESNQAFCEPKISEVPAPASIKKTRGCRTCPSFYLSS
ncbi:MAG: hypothetical protein HWD61_05050 [Parachlamydiaceae bacterium]|nr:MAG: hypothetical protein HWD61_05050 [Parachlamydiaceae bacterium]